MKFIVVSKKKLWKGFDFHSAISPDYIRNHYAGTRSYQAVNHFLETSKPGQYIEIDEQIYFNVTSGLTLLSA
jgi:hypothetical protein